MRPKALFLMTFGIVALLVCTIGIAAILMLKDTVATLAFATDPGSEGVRQSVEVLEQRIKAFGPACGVRSGKVRYEKPHLVVTLRGHRDLSDFVPVLLGNGESISLCLVSSDQRLLASDALPAGFERHVMITETLKLGTWNEKNRTEEPLLLRMPPAMEIRRVRSAEVRTVKEEPVIDITFTPDDSRRFEELTAANVGERLAVMIDGEVLVAPVIQTRIAGGSVRIQNFCNVERAHKLCQLIRIGALPVGLEEVGIRQTGTPQQADERPAPARTATTTEE